ncbi:hypothetical protein N2W52_002017 [Clostridium perfringens]|nr:hypothetical protein [Clostridium perfringens]MDK0983034.1 hypothetical protein [Clostridium perfringens]
MFKDIFKNTYGDILKKTIKVLSLMLGLDFAIILITTFIYLRFKINSETIRMCINLILLLATNLFIMNKVKKGNEVKVND